MSQNKYVLVCNDGTSHDLSRRAMFHETRFDLPDLLEQGWRPVHETPLGVVNNHDPNGKVNAQYAFVLILLVKD
jgi:hypothetical protein